MADDLIPDARPGLESRDVQTADNLLDALEDLGDDHGVTLTGQHRLRARGLFAVWAADLRAAGIAEGYRAGQLSGIAEARQAVLDALEGL